MEPLSLEELDMNFQVTPESGRTPRSVNNGESSSEVFSTTFPKTNEKRPQSVKTPTSRTRNIRNQPPFSSIPLPIKSSGISILSNVHSNSKTSSISASRSSVVANKHTLEIQFINKNKRYVELKKELLEKQKPVLDMYQNLLRIKKRLEELGKSVKLDDIKLVPYKEYRKPLMMIEGSGEVPAEMVNDMKNTIEEIFNSLVDVARNLLNRRALMVELLESIAKSEVDINDVCIRIEPLKAEGQHLAQSFNTVVASFEPKIQDLICKWQALECAQQSKKKAGQIENKLKEQELLVQQSNQVVHDLKKQLEEKRFSYDRSVAELNGVINALKERIQKLEQDLESERKASTDVKTRNSVNSQSLRTMRTKLAEIEHEKKTTDVANAEMQRKIKVLQEQIKQKETAWIKEKEELSKTLKHQESVLLKLNVDKTQFENTLEAIEEQKLSTEEELMKKIETLNEELLSSKNELEEITAQRDDALGKCAAFEGYIARMGIDCKEEMNKLSSSIEWGNALRNPNTLEAENYIEDIAKDLKIRELEDNVRKLEAERLRHLEEQKLVINSTDPTETEKQLSKQQECISKYQTLLEDSEMKLKEKSTEVANLRSEIRQLRVRQEALEEQNYSCPTEELQKMVEEGRHKLNELMKRSIESEQKLEYYSNVIEKQTQQMSEMENLLRYRENMAGVLKASRDELVLEKDSLTKYSQEMRAVLAEATKEGKMKDRLIKEMQEKIDLREKQISKLEKEIRDLENNLMLTNEKRFKLQETIGSMEKELQSTKAHVNQLADINSRNMKPKLVKRF